MQPLLFVVLLLTTFAELHSQTSIEASKQQAIDKRPTYINTGHADYDKLQYQIALMQYLERNMQYPKQVFESPTNSMVDKTHALESWNKSNEYWAKQLGIITWEDYQHFKLNCQNPYLTYPPAPKTVQTGKPELDEIENKKLFLEWSENHPAYPKRIDTGNPTQDDKLYRKAYLDFVSKYVKN